MSIIEYWNKFLSETGRNPEETAYSGEMRFEGDGILAFERLSLVFSGKRTASFSAFEAYSINREPLPVSGEQYIVLDQNGEPCGILELTNVIVLPLGDVSWELAKREGEADSLEEWRERTIPVLEDEGALCGFDVDLNTKVVCEIFRIIYR